MNDNKTHKILEAIDILLEVATGLQTAAADAWEIAGHDNRRMRAMIDDLERENSPMNEAGRWLCDAARNAVNAINNKE